jgi:hypothetical protein
MADKEPEPLPGTTPVHPENSIMGQITHSSMQSAMHLDKCASHPSTEMQVMMIAFPQLSKDLMSNQHQLAKDLMNNQ